MPIPPSGPITMGMINTELGYPATQIISLNDAAVRALAQVPAGMISLSNFYGKSNITPAGYVMGGATNAPLSALTNTIYEFNFSNETANLLGITTPSNSWLIGQGNMPTFAITFQPSVPTSLITRWQRFSFTSKTFTQVATQPTPVANFVTGGRLQDSVQNKAFTFGGTSSTPSYSFYTKFNLDTYTWSGAPWTTFSPGNSNNQSNQNSWTAAKNYAKGLSGFGNYPGSPFPFSAVRQFKVVFPTETVSNPGTNPTAVFSTVPGTNFNDSEFGYTLTGLGPTPQGYPTSLGRIVFSTETYTRQQQGVGIQRTQSGSWQTPTYGYIFGGTSGTILGEIRRYTFSNGTLTLLPASIPARLYPVQAANSNHAQAGPIFG